MARRKKIQEHENHERWLVSYADFITLLFAFFVVMYSISSVNEGKYRVLSQTLENVFSDPKRSITADPIQIGELNPGDSKMPTLDNEEHMITTAIELPPLPVATQPLPSEEDIRTINELSEQFATSLADLIATEDISINRGEDWLELEIKSKVLFGSGDAELADAALPVLGEIADILSSSANPIQVEGFTDDKPISTSRFPSNWELSAARAASVVHLLDKFGIQADRMSATGYGEYKPIADNRTESGRQKNRRVALVVLGNQHSRRDMKVFQQNNLVTNNPDGVTQ